MPTVKEFLETDNGDALMKAGKAFIKTLLTEVCDREPTAREISDHVADIIPEKGQKKLSNKKKKSHKEKRQKKKKHFKHKRKKSKTIPDSFDDETLSPSKRRKPRRRK